MLILTAVLGALLYPNLFAVINSTSTGGWIGHNYLCGDINHVERIRLELRETNYLVATKVDGDSCIGPGEISWEGEYNNPGTYPYTFVVKLWVRTKENKKDFIECKATMVNPNRIEIQNGSMIMVFTNESIVTPTISEGTPIVMVEEPLISPGWITNDPPCDNSWNRWYRFENTRGYFHYVTMNIQLSEYPTNSGIWRPVLPIAGKWRVEMYNSRHQNFYLPCLQYALSADTSSATYIIFHSSGKTQTIVDQELGGNTWIELGTYHFGKGSDGYVYLDNLTAEKTNERYVTFSPIRFVYAEP